MIQSDKFPTLQNLRVHINHIRFSYNESIDNTRGVVSEFSDIHIRYINTGVRVGMYENWEFALSYVAADFVMYLGDDDGLFPNAS